MESCEVQGCKSIISCARRVDPLFKTLLSFLLVSSIDIGKFCILAEILQDELTDDFAGLVHVLVRGIVNWRVALPVVDLCDINLSSCLFQELFELHEVHPLNVLVYELLIFCFSALL